MANRVVIVAVAAVVGLGLYAGLVFVEGQLVPAGNVAATGEVTTGNATIHLDRVGRPTVVGEVVNGRRAPIDDVSVTVRFLRDGDLVGTASASTLVPTVPRQSAAPFSVRLENQTVRPDDYEVTVEYDADADRPYVSYELDAAVSDISQDQLILVGTVENTGSRPVSTHVVATFYDVDGSVVGARSGRPSPVDLEPGAEGEFSIRFRTLGDIPSLASRVDDYELIAYGTPAG